MSITLGEAIWASVKPIIKIYLIIGVGFLLSKLNILTVEAARVVSDIVLTVLLPCLSFNKIVANIEDNDIKYVGIICLTAFLIFGTGWLCAYIVRRTLPVPKEWSGGILAGGIFPNISDLPIAYLQTMDSGTVFTQEQGNKGVANVIIFLAMFMLCVFNLGGFRLIESDFKYMEADVEAVGNGCSDAVVYDDVEKCDGSGSNDKTAGKNEKKGSRSSTERYAKSKEPHLQEVHTVDSTDLENTPGGPITTVQSNSMPTENVANSSRTKDTVPKSKTRICTPIELSVTVSDSSRSIDSSSMIPSGGIVNPIEYIREHNETVSLPDRCSFVSTSGMSVRETQSVCGLSHIRSIDQRTMPVQGMNDLIREYSNVDRYGQRRGRRRMGSVTTVQEDAASSIVSNETTRSLATSFQMRMQKIRTAQLTKILTSDATVSEKDIEDSGKSLPTFLQKIPITKFVVFFIKNCLRPCSISLILSLTIAFIPWVKALFVTTPNTPHIKQAPDGQPPLSFLMDFTSYVGAASVPFGLILLGAALGRLKIGKMYPGFWKAAVVLCVLRQCVMPILGVLWCDRLVKAHWLDREKDQMMLFVMTIEWGLPTMTTLIYFTASYTPPDCENPIQMNCVSFFLLLQYPLLTISLPFLVTYFLKVDLKK